VQRATSMISIVFRGADYPFLMNGPSKIRGIYSITQRHYVSLNGKREPRFFREQLETTMKTKILTVLGASLIAALTVQAADASQIHHARTRNRATVIEQFRNSNAYIAPRNIAVRPDWSAYDGGYDGALGSGMAGH
jgi:hypothetical protein